MEKFDQMDGERAKAIQDLEISRAELLDLRKRLKAENELNSRLEEQLESQAESRRMEARDHQVALIQNRKKGYVLGWKAFSNSTQNAQELEDAFNKGLSEGYSDCVDDVLKAAPDFDKSLIPNPYSPTVKVPEKVGAATEEISIQIEDVKDTDVDDEGDGDGENSFDDSVDLSFLEQENPSDPSLLEKITPSEPLIKYVGPMNPLFNTPAPPLKDAEPSKAAPSGLSAYELFLFSIGNSPFPLPIDHTSSLLSNMTDAAKAVEEHGDIPKDKGKSVVDAVKTATTDIKKKLNTKKSSAHSKKGDPKV